MNDSNDTSVAGGAAGADSRVLSADSALTERQRTILDVIRASVTSRGYPPSIREIGDAVGLTSTSSVAHQLRTLERKGYLRRDPNRPRAVNVRGADDAALPPVTEVAGSDALPEPTFVPVLGRIAAGGPILAEEAVEDVFPLPRELVGEGTLFLLKVLDVDMDRERVSLSLKATQEDPWRHFARTHAIGQIVPGKVTKLVPFGAFVRVEEGIEGLVHISELAERHVEVPDQVVAVGDDAMVKVIDIDLERRRISLSLKQANEDYTEEFDPAKYGMADSYDEQGNYIFPEGFDAETNEWLEGFEKQRAEWEARYAEAERRHKMHTAQMEKFAAAEAAGRGADDQSSASSAPSEKTAGGSLASDAQLAALREKLAGSA